MNQEQIGKLIVQCRKEKNLTQAGLAEKLGITEQAVSKWETGRSMPDAAVMLELCSILGITVNELLSGEKTAIEAMETEAQNKTAEENPPAPEKRKEGRIISNTMIWLLFSAVCFISIFVCIICDNAISGGFTWSFIPISSILFAWMTVFPCILWRKRRLVGGLCMLSALILPYLYLLGKLVKVKEVFSIGSAMAAVAVPFLWVLFAVFHYAGKGRRAAALGISFLLAVPFMLALNLILSRMLAEPVFDLWDGLSAFVLLILAAISFLYNSRRRKPAAA